MIDRTSEFVKAVKQYRKNEGLFEKKSLLLSGKPSPVTPFGKHSKEIVSSITKLRDFLLENEKYYVGSVGNAIQMTENERLKFDKESENCIKMCSNALASLKQREMPANAVTQENLHKKYTIELIEEYLKRVCGIYSKQQAIHVKRVVDKKRISRLQNDHLKKFPESSEPKPENLKENTEKNLPLYDTSDDELSPEDEEAFLQENTLLLHDMNTLKDEVEVIQGKVVEIAQLQKLFSEQVFKQEGEIDSVAAAVIESSENVKDGNEELREAIKNNAGFRVWILFFLVMCSFSLLFLEWYS